MQSNITSAAFECPGYIDIRLTNGAAVYVGDHSVEYHEDPHAYGEPTRWADFKASIRTADVADIACEHGGGNVWADFITLVSGLCIVVTSDGVYVYASADDAHDDDAATLAELYFQG